MTIQLLDDAIAELSGPAPDIARALGLIVMARLTPEPEPEPIRASNDLPPMVPISVKVRTIDVACPTCKVKAGKRCVRMSARGPNSDPTKEPLLKNGKPTNHLARTKLAREEQS